MKRAFLLSSIALIALSSCIKNEVLTDENNGNRIGFENYIHRSTKATETSSSNVTDKNINVYCYLINAEGAATLYFNDILSYGTEWASNEGHVHYWPAQTITDPATESLTFWAFHPSNGSTGGSVSSDYLADPADPANFPQIPFTVAADVNDQIDFMLAYSPNVTNVGGTHDAVSLSFHHAMSQIVFKIKGNDHLRYYVQSITLGDNDIKGAGKCKHNASGAFISWSDLSAPTSYTLSNSEIGEADTYFSNSSGVSEDLPASSALMLIPQTISGDTDDAKTKLTVVYYVLDAAGNPILGTPSDPVTKSIYIGVAWAQSNRYTYNLTLYSGTHPIEYSVSVEAWSDPDFNYNIGNE